MEAQDKPVNLLLIEKDEETRTGIERFFKMSGYTVTAVAGEKNAVQAVSDNHQDLIVFNTYSAPPESFALAYALHQNPALNKIPMIITSVHDHEFESLGNPDADDFTVAYITEVSHLDHLERLIKCIEGFRK
jgi:response regulator RpfG family c-di-GMP phosphodiesterase